MDAVKMLQAKLAAELEGVAMDFAARSVSAGIPPRVVAEKMTMAGFAALAAEGGDDAVRELLHDLARIYKRKAPKGRGH